MGTSSGVWRRPVYVATSGAAKSFEPLPEPRALATLLAESRRSVARQSRAAPVFRSLPSLQDRLESLEKTVANLARDLRALRAVVDRLENERVATSPSPDGARAAIETAGV